MANVREALWRVEYRTDLTHASAPVLPVGFLLEANWRTQARWLGIVFRRKLNPLEMDKVDQLTWPELGCLEKFMTGLFTEAWTAPSAIGKTQSLVLGSENIAARFSHFSALQFVREEASMDLSQIKPVDAFTALYGRLLGFRERLRPTISAPILQLKTPARLQTIPDLVGGEVESLTKAA